MITEKRSNPELNPKLTPFEELSRLVETYGDELYISFTQGFGRNLLPKLGINPRSTFTTPLGIYCYRASYVLEFTESEQELSLQMGEDNGGLSAPFTGFSAWHNAWVFRLDDSHALRPPMVELGKAVEELDPDPEVLKAAKSFRARSPLAYFWKLTQIMAAYSSSGSTDGKYRISQWNKILRNAGYTMVEDRGSGFIDENEPEQCVILDPRIIKPVTIIRRSESTERLNHDMRARATTNPAILNNLTGSVVSRLSSRAAYDIVDHYLEHFGNASRAKKFLDELNPSVLSGVAQMMANNPDRVDMSITGWHGVLASRSYDALNSNSIRALAHYTDYHIDRTLARKLIAIWEKKPEAVSRDFVLLMRHTDRFEDFAEFVSMIIRAGQDDEATDFARMIQDHIGNA